MHAFTDIPTTTLADVLGPEQTMDGAVRPLWSPGPRVAGPAFTVACPPGDNLMLHAAIYRAEPGSVIVVESGDLTRALAGGNVCAVAQRRGIAAFVVDGVIRDLAEVRELHFSVFGRGVVPVAGTKAALGTLGTTVRCDGVSVCAGDVVVADEDGVVVVPRDRLDEVCRAAEAKLTAEAVQSLDEWEAAHRTRIEQALTELRHDGG